MDFANQEPIECINLLCVDDESNILNALKRVFRREHCQVFTATSGAAGLDILKAESIDIVISDMRMPEMDGNQFLSKVSEEWPNTIRILLTGFSDLESTIDAVNKAGIYSYISKPWDDGQLVATVKNAARHIWAEKERKRLERVLVTKNEELLFLNSKLEELVKERTEKLHQTNEKLQQTFGSLKRSYRAAMPVFSHLINLREKKYEGYYDKITSLTKLISDELELDDELKENLYFAGLLHNVGKLPLPQELAYKPYSALNKSEKSLYETYPEIGDVALTAMENLAICRQIIRSHREKQDGSGYPDGLSGASIPLGAKILSIVIDYVQLQYGFLDPVRYPEAQASEIICKNQKNHYSPELVKAFLKASQRLLEDNLAAGEWCHDASALLPGMLLSRPILTDRGILILPSGHQLDESTIESLKNYEANMGSKLTLYIQK